MAFLCLREEQQQTAPKDCHRHHAPCRRDLDHQDLVDGLDDDDQAPGQCRRDFEVVIKERGFDGPADGQERPDGEPEGAQSSAKVLDRRQLLCGVSVPQPTDGVTNLGAADYLHSYNQPDRTKVLDAMKSAGMSTVRIFLTYIYAGNKGSNNRELPELEPEKLGVYDDTQLEAVDQLMVEAHARGIKLVIAVHDRYALGFWGTDVYATTFGIASPGSSGAQQIFDASAFYTSNTAMSYMDKRIRHVMAHKNKLTGLTWAQSDAYIYASVLSSPPAHRALADLAVDRVEAENEPMGHMNLAYPHWNCDRASTIRSTLPTNSRILVSTGGGITTQTSLADWAFSCAYFDIISVHDYGTTASVTANALKAAQAKTSKIVVMEEWGMTGDNKAQIVGQFVAAFKAAHIPWMYWEVGSASALLLLDLALTRVSPQIANPGQGANNFEVWTDEPAWKALAGSSAGGINKRSLSDGNEQDQSSSPHARSPLFVPAPNLVVPSARLHRTRDGHVPQIGHLKRFVKHGKRSPGLAHAKMG